MTERVEFTAEMKKTHTILLPNMLPVHFELIRNVLELHGYHAELLRNEGRAVADTGLEYVHNDTCYPALLVIGQMIDALKSGRYDLGHVALMITQTGGGCRASNYIFLLRKALQKAGLGDIPVISLNMNGMEKNPGFRLTLWMLMQAMYAVFYGDLLMLLRNQTRPYELHEGDAERMTAAWTSRLTREFHSKGAFARRFAKNARRIVADFASIPAERSVQKTRVGVVGEIYVKYSSLANNHLEDFLVSQGCEPVVPGLMGFLGMMVQNSFEDVRLYGKGRIKAIGAKIAQRFLEHIERKQIEAFQSSDVFTPPGTMAGTRRTVDGVVEAGCKMGEGWLLTGEMLELLEAGCRNIICAQPFGCLPNHIVGKGMQRRMKELHPEANIVAIDYDPGASRVNQENRIKLMLSVAQQGA